MMLTITFPSIIRGRETLLTVQRFNEIRKTIVADFNITNELGRVEGSSSLYDAPASYSVVFKAHMIFPGWCGECYLFD